MNDATSGKLLRRETRANARRWSPALFSIWMLSFTLLVMGCTPAKHRQEADRDANCLVDSKSATAGIEPASYRIEIDPRSRMFDPNDPDCEPMPPDDPTANLMMDCVDCKKGSPKWKRLPKTPFVENPGWVDTLPFDADRQMLLDLPGAVEMAILNSPRYQAELEELYLSALDVSFERFRFDSQFFGGSSVFFTADGKDRTGTGNPSSQFDVLPMRPGNRLRAEKLTATGGQLVVGMANSLVWQFAGPDDYSSNTILDFSLIQPLLRAGGRARVLERLTITERNLLANVREMERFRQGFYLSVVTGRDPGQGPSRRGGVFGGSGLTGFTGVGGGGFGRVGGGFFGGFSGGGGGFTGGAGAQGSGGYLGLLQSRQVLRNQYANVAALRDSVLQLEASNEAGRIDRFQVDLARQALFNAQSQLLTGESQYQAFLEAFLTNLGLPPELSVKVQDPLLDRLNLLDPSLEKLQQQVSMTLNKLRELRGRIDQQIEEARGELVVPNLPAAAEVQLSAEDAQRLATFVESAGGLNSAVKEQIAAVQKDFKLLEESLPQRRKGLRKLATRPELVETNVDPKLFAVERLDKRVASQKKNLQTLETRLNKSLTELEQLIQAERQDESKFLGELVKSVSDLSGQLLELSLAQAGARLETVTFEPLELTMEQALAIASEYRTDWKNARANLVDSWRLIHFNANDLRSDLNLIFSGDVGNVGDNPFDLRSSRGRLRMGMEFDAPLTRLAERNVYRQALIEYQQARRSYYQFRDGIYQGLRNTLRQIRLNELNFELRRAAVQLAISQVDLTQLRLTEPPKGGETTGGVTAQFQNTTARDLVQALGDLLNVQNDFLSVWVNHEVQQLNLEFDLGIMEVDPCGLRMENAMPLETYLTNLPCNTSDLGLAAEQLEFPGPVALPMPEAISPLEPGESGKETGGKLSEGESLPEPR